MSNHVAVACTDDHGQPNARDLLGLFRLRAHEQGATAGARGAVAVNPVIPGANNDVASRSMSEFANGLLSFPAQLLAHRTWRPDPLFFARFMVLLHTLFVQDASALRSVANVFILHHLAVDLLTAAAEGASPEVLRELFTIMAIDVDEADSQGMTAIVAACAANRLDNMKLLYFELGASLNPEEPDNQFPLIVACEVYLTRSQPSRMTQIEHNDDGQAQGSAVNIRREHLSAHLREIAAQNDSSLIRCSRAVARCRDGELQEDLYPFLRVKWQLFRLYWEIIESLRTTFAAKCLETTVLARHQGILEWCSRAVLHCRHFKKECKRDFNRDGLAESDRLFAEYQTLEVQIDGLQSMSQMAAQQQAQALQRGPEDYVQEGQRRVAALEDTRVIRWLTDDRRVDVNAADQHGNVALHHILNHGDRTLLHDACLRGDISMLTASWVNTQDINAIDNNGRTPLHLAAMGGHMPVVRMLIAYGADELIRDDYNLTAADLADRAGFDLVADEIIPRSNR